ncbi:right handed beta helix region/Chondroitinase B [Bellilinea caldifistulae]|nr:right handed beta helix region/Chondroitinase B [Bellilinea caldifistulae]
MRQDISAIITGITGKPHWKSNRKKTRILKTHLWFYFFKTILLITLGAMFVILLAENSANSPPQRAAEKNELTASLTPSITKLDVPNVVFLPLIANAARNTYYVSPDGLDTNPGTITQPWRTISKAVRTVKAGDIVYIRQGTYMEQVEIIASGSADSPVQLLAYPGEKVIIDGNNRLPSSYTALLSLRGSWIKVDGLEVMNSKYMGVGLFGRHNSANNLNVHHSQHTGVLISGDYGLVENSQIWRNSLDNEFNKAEIHDSGISAARDQIDGLTEYAIIRGNTVWENWGEGISSFEASHTLIENNISHDNLTANIYISDSTYVECSRNFVFMSTNSYIFGYDAHVGIMMGDEKYQPPSAHIKVFNNLAYNNHRNFYWWRGIRGGGMNDVLIAHNTFVNSFETAGVVIGNGSHSNVRFFNNIVQQDGTLPPIIVTTSPGIIYSNNLWSKMPASNVISQGDVIADPQLSKTGLASEAPWFNLSQSSPAIDKALPLAEVPRDYDNLLRDTKPDIGAKEYHP